MSADSSNPSAAPEIVPRVDLTPKNEVLRNMRRAGLPPIPFRMRSLPVDGRGYPVPFFIAWIDGKPDHRVADPEKFARAIRGKLCHLCGEPLDSMLTFIIGPMCGINRVSADPPDHLDCARWAAAACPFLTRPNAKRRSANLPEEATLSEHGLARNPGVTLLWSTRSFELIKDPSGGYLCRVGDPVSVEFLAEGRPATRDEVLASIESGLPLLKEPAEAEGQRAVWALEAMTRTFMSILDLRLPA